MSVPKRGVFILLVARIQLIVNTFDTTYLTFKEAAVSMLRAEDVADEPGISRAEVIRQCHALTYKGFGSIWNGKSQDARGTIGVGIVNNPPGSSTQMTVSTRFSWFANA